MNQPAANIGIPKRACGQPQLEPSQVTNRGFEYSNPEEIIRHMKSTIVHCNDFNMFYFLPIEIWELL